MQFIPGTHKLGVVNHVNRRYYLEIIEDQIKPRLDQAVDVVCDPGDIVHDAQQWTNLMTC